LLALLTGVPGAIACYERGRGYEGDFGFIDKVGGRGLGFGAIKAGAGENCLVKVIGEPLAS
jgi:hypothetical protein